MSKPEKTKVAPAATEDPAADLRLLDEIDESHPQPPVLTPPVAAAPPLTKDDVFSFIFARWGRGAFKGFTKHVLPGEYEEWLAQRDKWLADCTDILPE